MLWIDSLYESVPFPDKCFILPTFNYTGSYLGQNECLCLWKFTVVRHLFRIYCKMNNDNSDIFKSENAIVHLYSYNSDHCFSRASQSVFVPKGTIFVRLSALEAIFLKNKLPNWVRTEWEKEGEERPANWKPRESSRERKGPSCPFGLFT